MRPRRNLENAFDFDDDDVVVAPVEPEATTTNRREVPPIERPLCVDSNFNDAFINGNFQRIATALAVQR